MNLVRLLLVVWVGQQNKFDKMGSVTGSGENEIYLRLCQDILQKHYLAVKSSNNGNTFVVFNCSFPCSARPVLFLNDCVKNTVRCLFPYCYNVLFGLTTNSSFHQCLRPPIGTNRDNETYHDNHFQLDLKSLHGLTFSEGSSQNGSSNQSQVLPIPEALSENDDMLYDLYLQEDVENVSTFGSADRLGDVPANSETNMSQVDVFRSRYPVEDWKSLGLFTEDFLHDINSHWLQFHPPSHRSHYILAALYALVMTVGLFGNSLVIFMFLR